MNKFFTTLVALATLATLAIAAPVSAQECTPTTSSPEVDTGETGAGRYYADNDVVIGGFSFWIYQESNGIDGLQRGDEVFDDTCGGAIESDTIIF